MNISPKVSIVIPVYNGSNFLSEAIDSALLQTYNNIEVIVINDGSNDNGKTESIAKSYGNRIRYFQKENGGVASALNVGISNMTGDYFSWLSHDDLYTPDKIEKSVACALLHEKPVIVYCDYENISEEGSLIQSIRLKEIEPEKIKISLIIDRSLHGCSLLIPKKCFTHVSQFDETLRTVQDYDLWFKFADYFKFIHIPLVLVRSRTHPDQDSNKSESNHRDEKEALFTSQVKSLSEDDLKIYTKFNSIALTLLIMANSLVKTYDFLTSRYSLNESIKSLNVKDLRISFIFLLKLIYFSFSYIYNYCLQSYKKTRYHQKFKSISCNRC